MTKFVSTPGYLATFSTVQFLLPTLPPKLTKRKRAPFFLFFYFIIHLQVSILSYNYSTNDTIRSVSNDSDTTDQEEKSPREDAVDGITL